VAHFRRQWEGSHHAHINGRNMNLAYFDFKTSPRMKWKLPAIQLSVTRSPVALGTVTEHLPCFSVSVFVDVVM
jgi:hypothetical protein